MTIFYSVRLPAGSARLIPVLRYLLFAFGACIPSS
jgi:hypothetical protein